jgi:hypothetical protein
VHPLEVSMWCVHFHVAFCIPLRFKCVSLRGICIVCASFGGIYSVCMHSPSCVRIPLQIVSVIPLQIVSVPPTICLIYVDNCIIFLKTWQQLHLAQVLERFRCANLKARLGIGLPVSRRIFNIYIYALFG